MDMAVFSLGECNDGGHGNGVRNEVCAWASHGNIIVEIRHFRHTDSFHHEENAHGRLRLAGAHPGTGATVHRKGYVVVKGCFDRAFAKRWTDEAYVRLGYD
ncbi:MAG: hypothetical protein R2854_15435 [Caldilineaceae bacterium]